METIAGVKECEEAEVGAALRARDGAVSILSERAGIGPPDLCVVSKESTSLYGGRVQESTAFHYVLGLRCESAASVARSAGSARSSRLSTWEIWGRYGRDVGEI